MPDLPPAPELSIHLPCLNEAAAQSGCQDEARRALRHWGIHGGLLVADNVITDGSQDIARAYGTRVIDMPTRGCGAALRAGIESAAGASSS